ncbi:glycosyltransferase family 2 protein [Natronoglomus mannanivorans]|uniref:Glycosyltransferase n=1 Tax=Natronoglomus mannanivorans TaxID=2979990 RepID=A0AAP2Z0A7_9EURY|nr:glycosyltransferase [Halobacteria archaeon AArc-xg1-1]
MVEVSIVLPTYNRAHVVERAIDSVLDQSYKNWELNIVDDCSKDDTQQILQCYQGEKINVHSHSQNKGGGAARNTGIKHSTGEYIAFLDSDDEWLPQKLEKQVAALQESNDKVIANYCDINKPAQTHSLSNILSNLRATLNKLDREDPVPKEGGEGLIKYMLSPDFSIGGCSTLIVDRASVDQVNGFDERFPCHQDWEFLARILKLGDITFTDEELVVKNYTGNPTVEKIEKAKELLYDEFSNEIKRAQESGYDIKARNNFSLARNHMSEGNCKEGTRYFLGSDIKYEEMVDVGISYFKCFKSHTAF